MVTSITLAETLWSYSQNDTGILNLLTEGALAEGCARPHEGVGRVAFEDLPPLERTLIQAIEDKKGQDIMCLDVGPVFSLAPYFLLASGTSHRHLGTLCSAVREVCKQNKVTVSIQGYRENAAWVVVDAHTAFVHLFLPEAREYYRLEEHWERLLVEKQSLTRRL